MRTIVHPGAVVEVKHAYMRLLNNAYAQSDVRARPVPPAGAMRLAGG